MKKIYILLKTKKPGANKAFEMAKRFFSRRNYRVSTTLNKSTLKRGLDWALVLGGDGVMLHTANQLAGHDIPLVGVNFGHRGYLCQIKQESLASDLGRLNNDDYKVNSYTRIKAQIIRNNKILEEIDALNEIVVGGINRAVWLKLKVFHNQQIITATAIGDGVIFSTQIGSTAYNLYAGGPVLLEDAFSIVACNAWFESDYFSPNTKAFVAPTSASFEVKPLRGGQHLPYVVADGQRDYRLQKGDKVIIGKSPLVTKLIQFKN